MGMGNEMDVDDDDDRYVDDYGACTLPNTPTGSENGDPRGASRKPSKLSLRGGSSSLQGTPLKNASGPIRDEEDDDYDAPMLDIIVPKTIR